MELMKYVGILRRFWVSVAALALAGVALAALSSMIVKPTYTATTSVLLTVRTGGSAAELTQGSLYAESQVRSYAKLLVTPLVLQPVIDRLQLDLTAAGLASNITATIPVKTAIIEIQITGTDPVQTANIADEVSRQVVTTVQELSPTASGGARPVEATVVTPARVPQEWTSPKVTQNLLLGALLGLALGVGQAVLRSILDTRIKNGTDVASVSDVSVIGTIPFDADATEHPLIFQGDPRSARAEAYRSLRSNLQFLEFGDRGRSMVMTSSIEGEGKTTTSINVAHTLAESGKSVLLIDADLRRPEVANHLKLEGAAGLTTVIIGQARLTDVVQPFGNGNLHVLTSGQIPPNPSELLGSESMRRILSEALERYDTVILDGPPLLPVTDSAVLSSITGGALVVVGSGSVRAPELTEALNSLKSVGGKVLGLVVNKLKTENAGYRYHQHYSHKDFEPSLRIDPTAQRGGRRSAPLDPTQMIEPRP